MTLLIVGEQTVRTVGELRQTLLEAITPDGRTVLDIDGVEEADLSFVQALESARSHAEALGSQLRLAGPAPRAVREVLDCAGFQPADHPFWNQGVPTT